MNQPLTAAENRHASTGKLFARIHRYRNLFFKRWWVLVICVGLGLGVETAISRYSPPVFVSVGQMIMNIKLNIQAGSLYTEELGNFVGTQAALMQGPQVAQQARERVANQNPGLAPKPVFLTVTPLPKTTIFVLHASGEGQEYTKAYLQACMEEYINLKKQMAARTSDTTTAGITEQLLRLEPEIQKCDNEMQSFLATNDVALLAEVNGLSGYLTTLYAQLANAETESDLLHTMTLDQSLMLEQGQVPVAPSTLGSFAGSPLGNAVANGITAGSGMDNQAASYATASIGNAYLTVKQQLQLLKADRDRCAEVLKPKHPQMVALDLQLEKLSRVLDIYRQQSIDQLDARKTALALQITNLESQIQERGKQNVGLSLKAGQYQRLRARADRVQGLYDQLLATLQTLDVNKEISPESVTIYQPAIDAYIDKTVFQKGMLLAGVLGLGLGLVILLLLDRIDDRMNSFAEVEELFDEDVLGQIPRQRAADKKGGIIPSLEPNDQRHPFVEAYRNLRSSLLYMTHEEPRPRVLLVTSSVPGDGKSLTATNLAITMAMGGARVLLIDADLRKGALQKRLEVTADTGLAEVFLQGADWRKAVKPTAVEKLFLLPRGTHTQRSSEFFIGPVMEKLLKEAAQDYEYVVIDTAPVMAADDVTSLAPRVDGVLFVVRAEKTSARVARAALTMLYQRKANVLGLVFNSVHARAGDYYYYYRYSDYYGKG